MFDWSGNKNPGRHVQVYVVPVTFMSALAMENGTGHAVRKKAFSYVDSLTSVVWICTSF